MIFADASAVIALIAREPDALELADCLDAGEGRLISPIAAWETVAGLCHSHKFTVQEALAQLERTLRVLGFRYVTIGEAELQAAADAYARFGKGRHPAQLNMGDCFAYACSRTNGARLLFKGRDFAKTDIVPAFRSE
jgi:ribonuclease VapC